MTKTEWNECAEYIEAYRDKKITRAQFIELWAAAWVIRMFAAYNELENEID